MQEIKIKLLNFKPTLTDQQLYEMKLWLFRHLDTILTKVFPLVKIDIQVED